MWMEHSWSWRTCRSVTVGCRRRLCNKKIVKSRTLFLKKKNNKPVVVHATSPSSTSSRQSHKYTFSSETAIFTHPPTMSFAKNSLSLTTSMKHWKWGTFSITGRCMRKNNTTKTYNKFWFVLVHLLRLIIMKHLVVTERRHLWWRNLIRIKCFITAKGSRCTRRQKRVQHWQPLHVPSKEWFHERKTKFHLAHT